MAIADLILCERYGTKMTAAACEKFKATTPERCKDCSGPVAADVVDLFADVGKVIESPKVEVMAKNSKSSKPVRLCLECQGEKTIIGRGLCGGCYHRIKKSGDLDSKYPAKGSLAKGSLPLDRTPMKVASKVTNIKPAVVDEAVDRGAVIILKVTERDADLFGALQDWADDERRTIHAQVLYLLDRVIADRAKGLSL